VVASTIGSVFCLSGTVTYVRLSALLSISELYFADPKSKEEDIYRYWLWELGDDRWLTQLLLLHANSTSALQLDTSVVCETRATKNWQGLFSQRRRWLLGCISTDAHANFSLELWTKAFTMQLYRLLYQTIRVPDLHALMLEALIFIWKEDDFQYFGAVIWTFFAINWMCIVGFGICNRRPSTLFYPLLLLTIPIFNFMCRCYAIATLRRRTWGGPRVGIDPM
jgi:cellulose synthase/poly-beta-1,6-N-acetylglucosamine synthase-like glycosyltransferase